MFRNPRTLFRLAMVTLLVMLVWPRLIDPYVGISPDWSDGIRGVFLGLTLGLLFVSMRLKRRGPRVT
jgi:hypothetical protein